MNEIDKILEDIPEYSRRNAVAANPKLAQAITYFMNLKAGRDPRVEHISLKWFYDHKLRDKYAGPSYDVVRRFVTDFLKLNTEGNPRG